MFNTSFGTPVREVNHDGKTFVVRLDNAEHRAESLCIGTGLRPFVPELAKALLGPTCFHAKSTECRDANLTGKRVVIIGGGQTGAEIFLNGLRGLWGEAKSIRWVSRRLNLEALDESAFAYNHLFGDDLHGFNGTDASIGRDRIPVGGADGDAGALQAEIAQPPAPLAAQCDVRLKDRHFDGIVTDGFEFFEHGREPIVHVVGPEQ